MSPVDEIVKRLAFETLYLRDVLHVAGPGGQVSLSTLSTQRLFDGLSWCLNELRQIQAATSAAPPTTGGMPALPVPGGG